MPSTVFAPAIPTSNSPQTHALDHIAKGLLPNALFPPDMSPFFETQIYGAPSAVYCTLDHFTFSNLSVICQINLQQYTVFETVSHVISLKQKKEKPKIYPRNNNFP